MAVDDPPLHRFTTEDVIRMAEVGLLDGEARVELLDGVLIDLSPPGPTHGGVVSWLARHFMIGLPDHEVRVQDTLLVEGGFVLPDLIVSDPVARTRLPDTAYLIVEVAVTTLRHDRRKALRYARAGVDELWIVDTEHRIVAVHRRPDPSGYREVSNHTDGATIQALVGAPPVDVSELLG